MRSGGGGVGPGKFGPPQTTGPPLSFPAALGGSLGVLTSRRPMVAFRLFSRSVRCFADSIMANKEERTLNSTRSKDSFRLGTKNYCNPNTRKLRSIQK